jgi:hypothetical protein
LHSKHIYEVRRRKDHRGVDLISDALPFGSAVVRRAEHQSDTQSFAAAHIALWLGFTMKLAILSETHKQTGHFEGP